MTQLSQRVWSASRDAAPIEVSFEFFPPASDKAIDRMISTSTQLEPFIIRFIC